MPAMLEVDTNGTFLSTPSARRTTAIGTWGRAAPGISIHALREEDDRRRAAARYAAGISIHALREEDDPAQAPHTASRVHFYPRPPRGGRPGRLFLFARS